MPPKIERRTSVMMNATKSFGRDALFGASENAPVIVEADIDRIDPNPNQPRKHFDPLELEALKASLDKHGLKQPIGLRQTGAGRFELVFGERRFRAAKDLGWTTIFGMLTEGDSAEIALIENIQRVDLNPIEEYLAYQALMDRNGLRAVDLCEIVGKDKSEISRVLSLAKLPDVVRNEYHAHPIARYHLVKIARLSDVDEQLQLWGRLKADFDDRGGGGDSSAPNADRPPRAASPKPDLITSLPKPVARKIEAAKSVIEQLSQNGEGPALAEEDRDRLQAIRDAIDALLAKA